MALVYDGTRSKKEGGGWVNAPDAGSWVLNELPRLRQEAADRLARSQGRWNTADKFAYGAAAVPFAAAAAPAALGAFGGGGGVSSAATAGVGFDGVAPVATHGLMSSGMALKLGELGAGTFGNLYASHKQSKANDRALAYQQRANAEAMAYQREQDAEAKRQFDVQQAALKAQNDAANKFEADKWAASEDERLYDRRLRDEKEARRAAARERISGMLATGSVSPGMGSLGSYRRG